MMALPRKTRGEYRPIYETLFRGKDYRVLSPESKLILLTLKGLCGAMGITHWPALAESLSELTGYRLPSVRTALAALTAAGWIQYEDGIVWVVRGLEFEPQISHGDKHRRWFQNEIEGLPRAPIVDRMHARYATLFTDTPSIPHPRAIDSLPIPYVIPTTTTTTSPTPTLTPTTNHKPAEPIAVGGRLLAMAANKGISERYGEQPVPIMSNAASSYKAATALTDAGVDLHYAATLIFAYARELNLDRPPRSLGYFTQYVLDRWATDAERRSAAGFTPDASAVPSAPHEGDQLRSAAVRYARDGDPEWQAYCVERGIAWEVAA